jgi:short subunit fatty acids transporter
MKKLIVILAILALAIYAYAEPPEKRIKSQSIKNTTVEKYPKIKAPVYNPTTKTLTFDVNEAVGASHRLVYDGTTFITVFDAEDGSVTRTLADIFIGTKAACIAQINALNLVLPKDFDERYPDYKGAVGGPAVVKNNPITR